MSRPKAVSQSSFRAIIKRFATWVKSNYICTVAHGPVTDHSLEKALDKGGFMGTDSSLE